MATSAARSSECGCCAVVRSRIDRSPRSARRTGWSQRVDEINESILDIEMTGSSLHEPLTASCCCSNGNARLALRENTYSCSFRGRRRVHLRELSNRFVRRRALLSRERRFYSRLRILPRRSDLPTTPATGTAPGACSSAVFRTVSYARCSSQPRCVRPCANELSLLYIWLAKLVLPLSHAL